MKEDFSLILGGGILIVWGSFVSGLPDSYVHSFFGFDPFIPVQELRDMDFQHWTKRMINEIGIFLVLFTINYLISATGILVATIGGIKAIKDRKIIEE